MPRPNADRLIKIELQIVTEASSIPHKKDLILWARSALKKYSKKGTLCIRVVDEMESQRLNKQYRKKDRPTNVLSFHYTREKEKERCPLLGDLVICAAIVNREAKENALSYEARWAHIIIHGCLHLAGFNHDEDLEAEIMEQEEAQILQTLGFKNPYL